VEAHAHRGIFGKKGMAQQFNKALKRIARALGIRRLGIGGRGLSRSVYPPDFDQFTIDVCREVDGLTMTGPERIGALIEAARYVVNNNIQGAFVECGVWRGGSTIAMIRALQQLRQQDREIFLYDTFSGMSAPTEVDVTLSGEAAEESFVERRISDDSSDWCFALLEDVRENVLRTAYPVDRIHFVKGKVEETIPAVVPREIAILRLDTDWYESTKHELNHLFPLLSPRGVIIIDDYGHWQGAKKAVDEYIMENGLCVLLNRIDYTGRISVKMPE